MNSTCYFCHLNLGWHSAAVRCAQQTPASPHAAGTQALELGHHRDHSACSKVETRSSSKCYREFSEAHQSYENLFLIVVLFFCFFFPLFFLLFFPSLVSKRRHRASLQRAAQTHRLCIAPMGTVRTTPQVESWSQLPLISVLFPPIPSKSSSLDLICRFLSKSLSFTLFSLFLYKIELMEAFKAGCHSSLESQMGFFLEKSNIFFKLWRLLFAGFLQNHWKFMSRFRCRHWVYTSAFVHCAGL